MSQRPDADELLCVHPDTAAKLGGRLIGNPVDPIRALGYGEDMRKRAGIPKNAKVLLWVHRLSGEKWPSLAVRIGHALPSEWYTVLCGAGSLETEVAGLVGESGRVRWVGPVDNPGDWLRAADVFLSTADQEGFGLAVAEAMLAGVPVVSAPYGIAATPGLCRLVDHAGPEADVRPWVEAIVGRGGNPVAARELVATKYNPESIARDLEQWL
jgi:glycosyltransferase involved in cell wall biosynthesis